VNQLKSQQRNPPKNPMNQQRNPPKNPMKLILIHQKRKRLHPKLVDVLLQDFYGSPYWVFEDNLANKVTHHSLLDIPIYIGYENTNLCEVSHAILL
jgi:hypothetical protein